MKRTILALGFLGVMLGVQSTASAYNVGVGAKVGTLGYGLDLTLPITRHLNARTGINSYKYSYSASESDIDYKFEFGLQSFPLFLDYHPMAGRFRLTAGILRNGNKLEMTAKPAAATYNINGVDYNVADVGGLEGEITFNKNSPYIGLGFGNAVRRHSTVNFVFDLGLVFQGSPKVDLTATGLLASDAGFQSDLQQEEKTLEDDIDGFNVYPVIAFGISVKF